MKITRRNFILSGVSSAVLAASTLGFKKISAKKDNSKITDNFENIAGEILGASSSLAHKLREGNFPEPTIFTKKMS